MYGIPTAQGGVPREDHAGGLIHSTQLTVHVGEMLQTTTADELKEEGRGEGRRERGD